MPTNTKPLTQEDFLKYIQSVKQQIGELQKHIGQISTLHDRALNNPDSSSSTQLESVVAQAHTSMGHIQNSIKHMERDGKNDAWKVKHTKQVKISFQEQLQEYQKVEMKYRQGCQNQIARQYRIINPEASADEVDAASKMDWGNEGVFQAAVSPLMLSLVIRLDLTLVQLNSSRSGQASSALGTVRARHNELQNIENTLSDLATMFSDMAQLVDAQEDAVERAEQNTEQTKEDVQKGIKELDDGVDKIRNRNKLRRWCFFITILIILVIVLGVGLGIGLNAKKAR
jgi:syntaxin 1B/2/3